MTKRKSFTAIGFASVLVVATALFSGCDDDQEVLDVETPSGEVEVDEDPDTGEVDVEVDDQ